MGLVYRARHALTGRRVALKWITTSSLGAQLEARILREAQAMGRIEHPNVCAILDVGEDQGSMFLVMEYLEGMSLGDWTAGRPLMPAEIIRVLFGAMAGVAAAHREGVLHRDLKLDNIFVCLDKSGAFVTTKVLDFGISKLSSPHAHEVGVVTRPGQVMGTPHCMAPEQVLDDGSVDARVDVYALGVILYELLSERLPYEAENYNRLIVDIAAGPGAPLRTYCPDHDPELIAIVEKAIAHKRDDRFESVDALARALEPFAEGARLSSGSQYAISLRSSAPTLTPDELSAARLPTPVTPAVALEAPFAALSAARPPTPVTPLAPALALAPMRDPRGEETERMALASDSLIPGDRQLPMGVFAGVLLLALSGLAAVWWSGGDAENAPTLSEPASATAPTDSAREPVDAALLWEATEPAALQGAPSLNAAAALRPNESERPHETPRPHETEPAQHEPAQHEPARHEPTRHEPARPNATTALPAVVSPPGRTITGRSGVLDPDDF